MVLSMWKRMKDVKAPQDEKLYVYEAVKPLSDSLKKGLDILSVTEHSNRILSDLMLKMKEKTASITTALEEFSATLSMLNTNINALSSEISEIKGEVDKKYLYFTSKVEKIKERVKLVEDLIESVRNFHSMAKSVIDMVKGISDIAEQIGILSLNATIESARAGEQGKGFSVVAEEIGRLAAKTEAFAQKIHGLLSEFTDMVENTIKDMTRVKGLIEEVATDIEEIRGFLDYTKNFAGKVDGSISEFASAVDEQTQVIRSIELNVASLDAELQDTALIVKTLSKLSKNLAQS